MKNGMLSAKLFDSRIHSQNVTGKEKWLGYRSCKIYCVNSKSMVQ